MNTIGVFLPLGSHSKTLRFAMLYFLGPPFFDRGSFLIRVFLDRCPFFPKASWMLGFSFSILYRGVGASRSAGICGRWCRGGRVPGRVRERGLRTAMPCGEGAGEGLTHLLLELL